MAEMDEDPHTWEIVSSETPIQKKTKQKKTPREKVELSVHAPSNFSNKNVEISNRKYGFPVDFHVTERLFMDEDMDQTVFSNHIKNRFNRTFPEPKYLYYNILRYFEYCDNTPWMKTEAVKSGYNAGQLIQVPTQRPYTEKGLCIFLGITPKKWEAWKGEDFPEFHDIIDFAVATIENQLEEGALVSAFNPNVVDRMLGPNKKGKRGGSGEDGEETGFRGKMTFEIVGMNIH